MRAVILGILLGICSNAFAMAKPGEVYAFTDTATGDDGSRSVDTLIYLITGVDATANGLVRFDLGRHKQNGQIEEQQTGIYLSYIQDEEQYTGNVSGYCAHAKGTLETITVKAGTYLACRVENSLSPQKYSEWIVPGEAVDGRIRSLDREAADKLTYLMEYSGRI